MDIQVNSSSFHRLLYHTSEKSSGPGMGQGVGKFILTPIQIHKFLLKNSSNIIDTSLDLSFLLLENWRLLPAYSASLMGYQ